MRQLINHLTVVTPDDAVAAMLGLWAMRLNVKMTWFESVENAFWEVPEEPTGMACLIFGVPDEDSLVVLCDYYERVIVATPDKEPQSLYILPASQLSQDALAGLLR